MLIQDRLKIQLNDQYDNYIRTISLMAPSLKTLSLLMQLCKPGDSVLDLGSGFSSYVLRYYANELDLDVWSVDDNESWLDKSFEYCAAMGITKEANTKFYTWETLRALRLDQLSFDVVFVDLGRTRKRPDYYPIILKDYCNENTLALFDDMHKPILKRSLERELKRYDYLDIPVMERTRDTYGRYCKLVFRLRPKLQQGD